MWVSFNLFFMFSNFYYQLESQNNTCFPSSTLQWNINQTPVENQTSPLLVMIIEHACMSVDFLIKYKVSPNYVHY